MAGAEQAEARALAAVYYTITHAYTQIQLLLLLLPPPTLSTANLLRRWHQLCAGNERVQFEFWIYPKYIKIKKYKNEYNFASSNNILIIFFVAL